MSPDVSARAVACTFLVVRGLRHTSADGALDEWLAASVAAALDGQTAQAIDAGPLLDGYRRLYERVGVPGFRPAASAEELLRSSSSTAGCRGS